MSTENNKRKTDLRNQELCEQLEVASTLSPSEEDEKE
jgi:hypothetical protein